MRRVGFRLFVSSLTFVIGISTAAVWRAFEDPHNDSMPDRYENSEPAPLVSEEELTFTPAARACKPGWSQVYEVSDGEWLVEWSYPYNTPADAKRELRNRLKGALGGIERSLLIDENGNVRERAVAVYPQLELKDGGRVGIFWIEGNSLHGIAAPTMMHVWEFERWKRKMID